MGIDIKGLIVDALLSLCEEKPLEKITVADIQQESGISRQTFYNHFIDKFDLIQYIYEHRIIADWDMSDFDSLDYYTATVNCLKNDLKYKKFLKQACMMTGKNCLADFMYEHSRNYDRGWHASFLATKQLTADQKISSDYHSLAGMYMRLRWILGELEATPEELAKIILRNRLVSLNECLFEGDEAIEGPYAEAAEKIGMEY